MTFLQKLELIERVDGLIRRKATGSPDELASRLKISSRCLYELLELMKQMEAPIEYCKIRQSYFYSKRCTLVIGFIDDKNIWGRESKIFSTYSHTADLAQCKDLYLYRDRYLTGLS